MNSCSFNGGEIPSLSKDEFLDLFHTWRDHYLAKLEVELAEVRKRIAANDCKLRQIAEQCGRNETTSSASAEM